jgi:uncharacterized membrane protein
MIYFLAFLLGIVAGLRTSIAPAAASWAARFGLLHLQGSRLAFLGNAWTPWILTVLVLLELVGDQLPSTPSRTVPVQFVGRLVSGGLTGAAIGIGTGGSWVPGTVAGVVGAVVGTLGGREFRARLAAAFGRDRPAAFVEDGVAIAAAVLLTLAIL